MSELRIRVKSAFLVVAAAVLVCTGLAPAVTATTFADSATTSSATGSDPIEPDTAGLGSLQAPDAANFKKPPLGEFRKVCILQFHAIGQHHIDVSHPRWC